MKPTRAVSDIEIITTTQRLVLRKCNTADAAFMVSLVNTAGWLQYIGDRKIENNLAAVQYISNGPLKSYADYGFGLWTVTLKESGTPIGLCGLLKRAQLDHADIGFAFLRQYIQKGYAYESSNACLEYAKNTFGLKMIYGITLPSNTASIKLLEKIGLQYVYNITLGDDELMLFSTSLQKNTKRASGNPE